jgi:sec-independent protein translocase protein TatA
MLDALTPWHLALILIAFVLLVGYKKLPDATRSVGRSLRILKSEMQAVDDAPPPATPPAGLPAGGVTADELEAQARAAEARAAELRARLAGEQPA